MFGKQTEKASVFFATPALAGSAAASGSATTPANAEPAVAYAVANAAANAATRAPAASTQPSAAALRDELGRVVTKDKRRSAILFTIGVLAVVAAIAIIASTFFISVLQIRGNSMEPTFTDGQVVVATHTNNFSQGDVAAFYYNNKILLKRVVGFPGDWVDITRDGAVFINGELLQEDYLTAHDLGKVDIEFPYQVPEGRYFVLGDNRAVSVDSRSNAIGTVSDDQLIGKAVFRAWPVQDFGLVH